MNSTHKAVQRGVLRAEYLLWLCLAMVYVPVVHMIYQRRSPVKQAPPAQAVSDFRFSINEGMEGVDLWINEVYLGKTPVVIDAPTFREKVSPVTQAPEGAGEGLSESSTRCMGFYLRERPSRAYVPQEKTVYPYYARVAFHGLPGYGSGRMNSSSSRTHQGRRVVQRGFSFQVTFPGSKERNELLLAQARLRNYEVDRDWIEWWEAQGNLAWKKLYGLAFREWLHLGVHNHLSHVEPVATEPGLVSILDQWAALRFGLDQVHDPDSAWQAFMRMQEQVVSSGYSSVDMSGYALRRLIPHLDVSRFVQWACQRVQAQDLFRYYSLYLGGKPTLQSVNLWQRDTRTNDHFALDAILLMDRHLDAQDDTRPNPLEAELCARLWIQHWVSHQDSLTFAARLGGEGFDRVFARARRRAQRGDRRFTRQRVSSELSGADAWLLLLAQLDSAAGEQFRQAHAHDILSLVQKIVTTMSRDQVFRFGALDFLTLDTHRGQDCVGARLWPQVKDILQRLKHQYRDSLLHKQWKYLFLVEPALPLEAYVQCWQENSAACDDLDDLLELLNLVAVARRQQILQALIAHTRSRLPQVPAEDKREITQLLQKMQRMLALTSQTHYAQYIANSLDSVLERRRNELKSFIRDEWQNHPFGQVLIHSANRELRRLAVDLIAAYPIGEHVDRLEALLQDEDGGIRRNAQKALERLQAQRLLSWKTVGQTGPPVRTTRSRPVSVQARIYRPDRDHSDAFEVLTLQADLIQEKSRDAAGQTLWTTREVQMEPRQMKRPRDKRIVVVLPADQNDVDVQAWMGHTLYASYVLMGSNAVLRKETPRPYRNLPQARSVRILDAHQDPIAEAEVSLVLTDGARRLGFRVPVGKTDTLGHIDLPALGNFNMRAHALYIAHRDYGATQLVLSGRKRSATLSTTLLHANSAALSKAVRGRVLDLQGRPVKQARVTLLPAGRRAARGHRPPPDLVAYTDDAGHFALGLPDEADERLLTPKQLVRVEAPAVAGLLPYIGECPVGEPSDILMGRGHSLHRFVFADANGLITDPNVLGQIQVTHRGAPYNVFTRTADQWRDPIPTPPGQFDASHKSHYFRSVQISASSPESVTFAALPFPRYTGRIVHGITGEPLAGAFISFSRPFNDLQYSDFNDTDWTVLHQWSLSERQSAKAEALLRKYQTVDGLTRSSTTGRFRLETHPDIRSAPHPPTSLSVFEKDYMPFSVSLERSKATAENVIDVGDVKLFPAARIKLGIDSAGDYVQIMPIPIIDPNNSPAWTQVFERHAHFSYHHWHRLESPRWIHVPAEVSFKLYLNPGGSEWTPHLMESSILLEQGQTLDLGTVKLEPMMEVVIRVTDAKGQALPGVAIYRVQDPDRVRFPTGHAGRARFHLGQTDQEGKRKVTIYPDTEGEFEACWEDKTVIQAFRFSNQGEASEEFVMMIDGEEP